MPARRLVPTLAVAALVLAACTADAKGAASSSSTPLTSRTNASGEPDPHVPYSPPPRPDDPVTEGYAGDTLTLPTADDGTLRVTLVSTALDTRFVDERRAFDVWLTLENPGDTEWSGVPAGSITITDAAGAVFRPVVAPTAKDLHPDPERYGGSNLDLDRPRTIGAGRSLDGVAVFRIPGGFRPITIAISFDAGATWGTWETSFGPY
jgi:hypothetical protein